MDKKEVQRIAQEAVAAHVRSHGDGHTHEAPTKKAAPKASTKKAAPKKATAKKGKK